MGYPNLQTCVQDLEQRGQLIRINQPIDPNLEAAAIQRRVYAAAGPALLFTNVTGSQFPMLGNLFGTLERTRFIFRDTLTTIQRLVDTKVNPAAVMKKPWQFVGAPRGAWHLLPKRVKTGPIMAGRTTIDKLPQLVSWPDDGGPFITLPQVYSEDPHQPGLRHSNLGMYRVQLGGNEYQNNREVGLHYQIQRGIGVHHNNAKKDGNRLPVNIFVGGAPSLTVAAVMPLPEGMPELSFAGLLAGRRMAMVTGTPDCSLPFPAEADFVICGSIDPTATRPEGPFGDHLGYYSLKHEFPVMQVDAVYHRRDAIWPFTSVGRPPQEDTSFGTFIHELTGDLIPTVLPGIKAVHAVDAAGVHPLLLALGSERYTPYSNEERPQELLTQGCAILGQGQLSLAKYLLIANSDDCPQLDIHDIDHFFTHVLKRCDWRRDLHFHTCTTTDTLDYSGNGLNSGSKVVIAASGKAQRELPTQLPAQLELPAGFSAPHVAQAGIMVIQGAACTTTEAARQTMEQFCPFYSAKDSINNFPLLIISDDSEFAAANLNNFLWTTFTRSDPAQDIYGIDSFCHNKHWGCNGALIIDARRKPHHAPPLIDDPEIEKRIDKLGIKGAPLHGII
ncbi:MAG: 3-octaprenyl-4-hydroxybenzoate carboxy-lyase [Desulfobacteraceae bacterium 4572_35.1]|nr:MAG: 3-octaprenyl-4-hydroxybenzoate carboxy-lyase [Desulfobacteraceae bacterium 4572_35.1]